MAGKRSLKERPAWRSTTSGLSPSTARLRFKHKPTSSLPPSPTPNRRAGLRDRSASTVFHERILTGSESRQDFRLLTGSESRQDFRLLTVSESRQDFRRGCLAETLGEFRYGPLMVGTAPAPPAKPHCQIALPNRMAKYTANGDLARFEGSSAGKLAIVSVMPISDCKSLWKSRETARESLAKPDRLLVESKLLLFCITPALPTKVDWT